MYRCDNHHIDNVFVEGIAGASLYMDRTRVGCKCVPIPLLRKPDKSGRTDINIVYRGHRRYIEHQMWTFSRCFARHGLHLDDADKITIHNLMVPSISGAGTPEFLANFHAFSINRFRTDLFQQWLDTFNDATTGGIWTRAINATNGSSPILTASSALAGLRTK